MKVEDTHQQVTVAKENNDFKIKNVESVQTVEEEPLPKIKEDIAEPIPVEATSTIGKEITQLVHT